MDKFTCANCTQTFNKEWTEEEAVKEFKSSPWYIPNENIDVICDDCFEEFKEWFETLTDEDHKRLRNGR